MTKPTLAFQPEAERYYAEGHWRDGDLWEDFAARVDEHPDKVALVLDDREVTFDELRRAAIGVSSRLADGGVEPGDVVILLGRHSIEAAVAMLGCLHRGVVLAPLPPMFNATQLSALLAQTRRHGRSSPSAARRRSPSAARSPTRCRSCSPSLPELVDELAASDLPADRAPRARRRPRDGPALLRARRRPRRASRTRATRCATPPRASAGAGS